MSDMPERIWINKVFGQHPEDWDFTTGEHLTKSQLKQKVEYVRADLVSAARAEAMAEAAAQDEIAILRIRALRYVAERNEALNMNCAQAQQLARAWAEADKARAALRGRGE
jgi:hypothetical protein